jgi:CheY-like chemotaxis protein
MPAQRLAGRRALLVATGAERIEQLARWLGAAGVQAASIRSLAALALALEATPEVMTFDFLILTTHDLKLDDATVRRLLHAATGRLAGVLWLGEHPLRRSLMLLAPLQLRASSTVNRAELHTALEQLLPDQPLALGTSKILLVHDEEQRAAAPLHMLQSYGYVVEQATHSGAALTAARRQRYDLLLFDSAAAELGGAGALAAIRGDPRARAQNSTAPAIALTPRYFDDAREHLLALGFSAVLARPFTAYDLRCTVEAWRVRDSALS